MMDENKKIFFRKLSSPQFKRKGVDSKKGIGKIEKHEGINDSPDTVYRILCPSRKIGGVIGKGGTIVKALREETHSKITVSDSVSGSDERVITIYSSSSKVPKEQNDKDLATSDKQNYMEPHCAAQDALLKVHDRIVEEDTFGGMASEDGSDTTLVTVRLLVPNNIVGCVLGKGGDVIRRLRSEIGATIRVLPSDHLPTCAMNTDELVQISGKPNLVKKALYQISTLLYKNPRKGEPPLDFPMPRAGRGFHPPSATISNMVPPRDPMWSHRSSDPMQAVPLAVDSWNHFQPAHLSPDGYDDVPSGPMREAFAEFSIKVLCSVGKIGGVIGKGGKNVKQLQQETGASIHVEDVSKESDERVIRVSAVEALVNPRSQAIEAILQLQDKASEFSEKGIITTRILVPSSKVGCILGQGGHIINEMRRRTQADIRVFSKDDKPKIASEDEELVQVSGNFVVARDAMAEILSRLRVRTLREASAGAIADSVKPPQRVASVGSLPPRRPSLSGPVAAGISGVYEHFKGGQAEYEHHDFLGPQAAAGYPNIPRAVETRISNRVMSSGAVGSNNADVGELWEGSMKLQDLRSVGSELVRDSHPCDAYLHSRMNSSGQCMRAQQSSYQSRVTGQGSYQNKRDQPSSYPPQSPYSQHVTFPYASPPQVSYGYPNIRAQESSYRY